MKDERATDEAGRKHEREPLPLDRLPTNEVGRALIKATEGIPRYYMGYLVLSLLRERLHEDDELFEAMCALAAERESELDLRIVLLDVLESRTHRRDGRLESFRARLADMAANEREDDEVRALSLRLLKPDATTESTRLLTQFLTSRLGPLVNAAGHVLVSWRTQGVDVPRPLLVALVRYARASSKQIYQLPGALMALSHLGTDEAERAFRYLVEEATTANDRASLLRAAGAQLAPEPLARVIGLVKESGDAKSARSLGALFSTTPRKLDELYSNGHFRAYLTGLELALHLIGRSEIDRLIELRRHRNAAVRKEAHRVIMLSPPRIELADFQSKTCQLHPRIAMRKFSGALNSFTKVLDAVVEQLAKLSIQGLVEPGYTTEYHRADGVYRDLGVLNDWYLSQNHWHVFLYRGFETDGTKGELSVLQSSGSLFSTMQYHRSSIDLSDPEISVAESMSKLQDLLHAKMKDGGSGNIAELQGPRRTPGLTAERAEQIISTGESMVGKGMAYTWANQLQSHSMSWSGAASDIAAVRCDGVTEYCYEKNGQRVCGGLDSNLWNVASPGFQSLWNHNDFHNLAYEDGELCPRIQAGDHSDPSDVHDDAAPGATRMSTIEGPTLPQVTSFYVNPKLLFVAPMIGFRIDAERYDHAYARLTVSRDGGPFRFVKTTGPYGGEEAVVEDWEFVKVRTAKDIVGWWTGKTVDGPDHAFETGPFEFRLVAVDLAGNVSDLRRVTVDEVWP